MDPEQPSSNNNEDELKQIMAKKKFATSEELEYIHQQRLNEWDRVRKITGDIKDYTEREKPTKSLFEQLEANKAKEQEQYEESLRMKNRVYKGLNEEESVFLNSFYTTKIQQARESRIREIEELKAFREGVKSLEMEKELSQVPGLLVDSDEVSKNALVSHVPVKRTNDKKRKLSDMIRIKSSSTNSLNTKAKKCESEPADTGKKTSSDAENPKITNPGLALLQQYSDSDENNDDESEK